MLKTRDSLKEIEDKGYQAFVDVLARVPDIKINEQPRVEVMAGRRYEADFIAEVWHGGKTTQFVGEVKSNGQPRNASAAIAQVKAYIANYGQAAQPVFIAPFLSKETRALCETEGVNYVDLAGNARIAFEGIYIEREAADNPFKERRELRSLFKPKAAQVLKVLIRYPGRIWRMAELADQARVSLGQVSNVKKGLLDQGWASAVQDGLYLNHPKDLLEAWREGYKGAGGSVLHFYTTLHGGQLNTAILSVLSGFSEPHAALASFSAAEWYAPYGRVGHEILYADQIGLDQLTKSLKLVPAAKGGNVVITFLYDDLLTTDAEVRGPGLWCTSPVQTYLDLSIAGERGREAADHLHQEIVASW